MDDLLDMIQTDESPSQISDKIKELLFAKSAGHGGNADCQVGANFEINNGYTDKDVVDDSPGN